MDSPIKDTIKIKVVYMDEILKKHPFQNKSWETPFQNKNNMIESIYLDTARACNPSIVYLIADTGYMSENPWTDRYRIMFENGSYGNSTVIGYIYIYYDNGYGYKEE